MLYVFFFPESKQAATKRAVVVSCSHDNISPFANLLTTEFRIYKNGVPGRYMCNGTRAFQSYSNCLKINVFGSLGSTVYQSHVIYSEK